MGGTLNEQCRVSEEGLRIVKLCCKRKTDSIGNDGGVMVSYQKATANYVPAAAVIRRWHDKSVVKGSGSTAVGYGNCRAGVQKRAMEFHV